MGLNPVKNLDIWRPRSLVYLGLFLIFFTILGVQLATRKDVDIGLLRAREIPFQIVQDDQGRKVVLNHFVLHLKNQTHHPIPILLALDLPKSEDLPNKSDPDHSAKSCHLARRGRSSDSFFC